MKILGTMVVAAAMMAALVSGASAATSFTAITDWTPYNFAQSGDLAGGSWVAPKLPLNSSTPSVNLSPYATGVNANPAADYYAIGPANGGTSAVLSFGTTVMHNFSFVWGSVDDYNTVEFLNAANTVVFSVLGSALGAPKTAGAQLAQFFGLAGFTKVRFTSSSEAFELGFVTASVPLPAGVLLLGSAMAGLGFLGRRRKQTMTATAA